VKAIPVTAQTLELARRVIWFEPPEQALADPIRFLAYAMSYARHEDMRVIRQFVSDDDFRYALDRAPAGVIDRRSWAYWNAKMGRFPVPPMPQRNLATLVDIGRSATRDPEEIRRRARQQWRDKYVPGAEIKKPRS
jgi:hypothetical protein